MLTARIEAPVAAECTRCLKPIKRDWGVDVVAFFPYEESAKARSHGKPKNEDVEIVAGEDESEDVYPLSRDGAFADLEALLRDTLAAIAAPVPRGLPGTVLAVRRRPQRAPGPSS